MSYIVDYSQFLIVDLKATAWEHNKPINEKHEIIGIDLALIDTQKQEVIEKEKMIVKPQKSRITEYCHKTTGISQDMVDKHGMSFEEAYRKMRIHYMSRDRLWGYWVGDENYFLNAQCRANDLESLSCYPILDICYLFTILTGKTIDGRTLSVEDAYEHMNINGMESNNAANIARIMLRMGFGCRPTGIFSGKKK